MAKGKPSVSRIDAAEILKQQDYKCAVCKMNLKIKIPGTNIERELKSIEEEDPRLFFSLALEDLDISHKLPRSTGAKGLENLEFVCKRCNASVQKNITLPESVWDILDAELKKRHGDGIQPGMYRGYRIRHLIMDYVASLELEEE